MNTNREERLDSSRKCDRVCTVSETPENKVLYLSAYEAKDLARLQIIS